MSYEIAIAVKQYLIDLALNDKLPTDMNDLNEFQLSQIIESSKPVEAFGYRVEDVKCMIDNINLSRDADSKIEFSNEFAEEVLETMLHKADCSYGISFDTLGYYIDYCNKL